MFVKYTFFQVFVIDWLVSFTAQPKYLPYVLPLLKIIFNKLLKWNSIFELIFNESLARFIQFFNNC